jgi:signal transduction histidine kinase
MNDGLKNAIEEAARYLPDGWSIEIRVEKGSGCVYLMKPDGTEVPIDDHDRVGLEDCVRRAILYTIANPVPAQKSEW